MVGRMIREAIETVADEVSSSLNESLPSRTVTPPPMPLPPPPPSPSPQVQPPAPEPVAAVATPLNAELVAPEPPARIEPELTEVKANPAIDDLDVPDRLEDGVDNNVEVSDEVSDDADDTPASESQDDAAVDIGHLEIEVLEARLLLQETKRDLRVARRAERKARRLERSEYRRDRRRSA